MKTIIQGKNLKTTYRVDYKWKTIKNDKNEDITVFTGKPELIKEMVVDSWETIAEFDEKIDYNSKSLIDWGITFSNKLGYINLTEDEVIGIVEKITRIDLGAYILHTDKVLKEEEILKKDSEDMLNCQIRAFNKMMIESNDKLLAYCNLHKLNPEDTDVDELFKVVYPNDRYYIEDGKLIIVNTTATISTSGMTFGNNYRFSTDAIVASLASTITSK